MSKTEYASLNGPYQKKRDGVKSTSRRISMYVNLAVLVTILRFLGYSQQLKSNGEPSAVLDEAHFWKTSANIYNKEWSLEVGSPPLAHMANAAIGYLNTPNNPKNDKNTDDNNDFEPVKKEETTWSVKAVQAMRLTSLVCGIGTVLVVYSTLEALMSDKSMVPLMAACLLACDNATNVISRWTLLEGPHGILTALALRSLILASSGYYNWEYWMAGLWTGLAFGTRWSALPLLCLAVWLRLAWTSWTTEPSLKKVFKHVTLKFFQLAVIPLVVYLAIWVVFLEVMRGSKVDSIEGRLLSPGLLLRLQDKQPESYLKDVLIGSHVTIRQYKSLGERPFLHSHAAAWPTGSHQQQITGYPFASDPNNTWIIRAVKPGTKVQGHEDDPQAEPGDFVTFGQPIRLQHAVTGRFLHSHAVDPVLSDKEHQWEISAYGDGSDTYSDANDLWHVAAVNARGQVVPELKGKPIETLSCNSGLYLRLVHVPLGCYFNCVNKRLPQWAFGQAEITCGRDTAAHNGVWYIESNRFPPDEELGEDDYQPEELVAYKKSSLLNAIGELHRLIFQRSPPQEHPHPAASAPWMWPLGWHPFLMHVSANNKGVGARLVYLPNPVTWFLGLGACLFLIFSRALAKIRPPPPSNPSSQSANAKEQKRWQADDTTDMRLTAFLGWALEILGRLVFARFDPNHVTFLFQYQPALLASILLLGLSLNRAIIFKGDTLWGNAIILGIIAACLGVFAYQSQWTFDSNAEWGATKQAICKKVVQWWMWPWGKDLVKEVLWSEILGCPLGKDSKATTAY